MQDLTNFSIFENNLLPLITLSKHMTFFFVVLGKMNVEVNSYVHNKVDLNMDAGILLYGRWKKGQKYLNL